MRFAGMGSLRAAPPQCAPCSESSRVCTPPSTFFRCESNTPASTILHVCPADSARCRRSNAAPRPGRRTQRPGLALRTRKISLLGSHGTRGAEPRRSARAGCRPTTGRVAMHGDSPAPCGGSPRRDDTVHGNSPPCINACPVVSGRVDPRPLAVVHGTEGGSLAMGATIVAALMVMRGYRGHSERERDGLRRDAKRGSTSVRRNETWTSQRGQSGACASDRTSASSAVIRATSMAKANAPGRPCGRRLRR
jgi:hypothetical protein